MMPNHESGLYHPARPLHMVWLATNKCNARCLHCSSASARRTSDELTTEEACRMIDQLVDAGVVDLGISGGEPLLRKDIFALISYARERGLKVGIATNGARMTLRTAKALAAIGIDRIQFSLDGLAEQHDKLRQWKGLYDRVVAGIMMARNVGLRVHVCCTISQLNADRLTEFVDSVTRLDVQRINFSRYIPVGRGTDALDLADEQWRFVIEQCMRLKNEYRASLEIVTHLAQQILVDEEVQDMAAFTGCQAGQAQGCITANGTVQPCVLLPLALGNLRSASFTDIWDRAPVNHQLRQREHLEGRCGQCKLRSRCGGCRALAYARTGNFLSSDPRCWLSTPVDSHPLTSVPGEEYANQKR
jgi:radical SAM protein with 4Fe4S-binding SPASM domain